MPIDLSIPQSIHIIGIGGAGMSAIATVLLNMGHQVSGSDAASSPVVERLQTLGAAVGIGHDVGHMPAGLTAIAYSTAVTAGNPERREGDRRGLPVLRRAEILQAIASQRKTLAVAGTHGKTTTSTLLAQVMESAETRPSWIIGGEIAGKDGGAHWDAGEFFVVEADESDGTFLELGAYGVIVTNVEADHLEFYGSLDDRPAAFAALEAAFARFVDEAPGPKVVCLDDDGSARLSRRPGVVTYGVSESADYRIENVDLQRFSSTFSLTRNGETLECELHIPGLHNVRNATAAVALAHGCGVPLARCAEGISAFRGVGRRFTHRGEKNDVVFVDEYAHLPGEVRAALAAARAGRWKRVVAVFQPHRYSRTEQVGHEFTGAFDDADVLVLAGVYAAGEAPRPGVDGHLVERAVVAGPDHPPITYVEDRAVLASAVAAMLQPGDLCITLGAGDVTKLADEVQVLL